MTTKKRLLNNLVLCNKLKNMHLNLEPYKLEQESFMSNGIHRTVIYLSSQSLI